MDNEELLNWVGDLASSYVSTLQGSARAATAREAGSVIQQLHTALILQQEKNMKVDGALEDEDA